MKIRSKLLVGFAIVVMLVGVVGFASAVGLGSVLSQFSHFEQHTVSEIETWSSVKDNTHMAMINAQAYVSTGDESLKQRSLNHLNKMREAEEKFIRIDEGLFGDQLTKTSDMTEAQLIDLIDSYEAGASTEVISEKISELAATRKEIMKFYHDNVDVRLGKEKERATTVISNAFHANIWTITTLSIASVFVAVVSGGLISRSVSKPIYRLKEAAAEIARGNYDSEIKAKSKDEVGDLASSFDNMRQSLKALMAKQIEVETLKVRAEAADELARSNAELQQYAYVASHDLQEPLRKVVGYTQLLANRYKGKLDADADKFMATTMNAAHRMQTLISDLLAYTRLGTGGRSFEPTDCNAVLDRAVSNLQVAIDECHAIVTHDPLPTVTGDATQLTQLFQNLISNAIKFRGEETPHVHISGDQKENDWIFTIRDNGIGIDPAFSDRIFVMFQRLHERGKYPGTGIGLAICKKIVERHDGCIWVESQPGNGTTFHFTIPMKKGA